MAIQRIVGLGLAVIDHVFQVDRLDLEETRTRFTAHVEQGGGMVGTALSQAARLGCNAHILSLVGDDRDGRAVRRSLASEGVVTRRLILSRELPTTQAVVLVERRTGERRFLVADRRALERAAPDFDLSPIDRRALLLVDGHFPAQARRAVRRARAVGAAVIGDFSDPGRARALLPYVDYPIVPLEFAEAFAGADPRDTLRALHARYGGTPVVTLGRRGGVYLHGGRVRRFRAPRVRTVDSTGAGDVFHGAFAAGLYHGMDFAACLELAARAAALNCTALGGRGRLMTRAESEIAWEGRT